MKVFFPFEVQLHHILQCASKSNVPSSLHFKGFSLQTKFAQSFSDKHNDELLVFLISHFISSAMFHKPFVTKDQINNLDMQV